MTKRDSKTSSTTPSSSSHGDLPGPGKAASSASDGQALTEAVLPRGCRVALRENIGPGIADSLLRYVNDFGQGKGTALVVDGLIWLELQFHEDRDMLKSQFRDLIACPEAAHGRGP